MNHNAVDVIISDWEMPRLSGEEFLSQVCSRKKWKGIPFIMMTEHSEKDLLVTAIRLDVTNSIVKPFTASELTDKIKIS